jgi:hypothetical protein
MPSEPEVKSLTFWKDIALTNKEEVAKMVQITYGTANN